MVCVVGWLIVLWYVSLWFVRALDCEKKMISVLVCFLFSVLRETRSLDAR